MARIIGEFLSGNGVPFAAQQQGGGVLTPWNRPGLFITCYQATVATRGDVSNRVRPYLEGYLKANGVHIRTEGQANRLN